ncbi:MAG: VanZ family protein [Bacteroidales bacterium]|nr:VanZ family protein [Bacteroidales bacterium]MBN2820379.1 VanZ family protein [Bacteroidales bacterium]
MDKPVSIITIRRLAIIYILILVALSVYPFNMLGHQKTFFYKIEFRLDYLTHFIIYLPFIWLFIRGLNKKIWVSLLWGFLTAVGTEYIQYHIPYRTFNINDLLANVFGILAGALLFLFFIKHKISSL